VYVQPHDGLAQALRTSVKEWISLFLFVKSNLFVRTQSRVLLFQIWDSRSLAVDYVLLLIAFLTKLVDCLSISVAEFTVSFFDFSIAFQEIRSGIGLLCSEPGNRMINLLDTTLTFQTCSEPRPTSLLDNPKWKANRRKKKASEMIWTKIFAVNAFRCGCKVIFAETF
jgi:hypothetical protein